MGIEELREKFKPETVRVLLVSVVRAAIKEAGITTEVHVLPFPGNGHQNKYVAELAGIVRELANEDTPCLQ